MDNVLILAAIVYVVGFVWLWGKNWDTFQDADGVLWAIGVFLTCLFWPALLPLAYLAKWLIERHLRNREKGGAKT